MPTFQASVDRAQNIEQLCSTVRNNYPDKDKSQVVNTLEYLKDHEKLLKLIAHGKQIAHHEITTKYNIRARFTELSKAKFKLAQDEAKANQAGSAIFLTSYQRDIANTKSAEDLIALVKLQSATSHEGTVLEDAMKRVINARPDQLFKFAEKGMTPYIIPEENGVKTKLQFFAKQKLEHLGESSPKPFKKK